MSEKDADQDQRIRTLEADVGELKLGRVRVETELKNVVTSVDALKNDLGDRITESTSITALR